MVGLSTVRWVVLAVAGLCLLAWAGLLALLSSGQEEIIFPAPRIDARNRAALAAAAGARELQPVAADGAQLYAWHVPARGERAVLYFHGNGESAAWSGALAREVVARGWDFVVVSPRGYPGTTGRPGRGTMAADARAAWRLATEELGFSPQQIVLHGRSLGGGLVGSLIGEVEPAGVIFESTFLSIERLAQERLPLFPVRWVLRHPARTEVRAPQLRSPALVLHGTLDEVIPVSHGRRLAALLPDARYIEVADRGHNDDLLGHAEAARAWEAFLRDRIVGP